MSHWIQKENVPAILKFGWGDGRRKVLLNMKEQKKYEMIKKLCEVGENKQRAAITLGVSIRTMNPVFGT